MPNYTENLNLEKPLQSEGYNIDIFNSNADKIDNEFGKVNNKISGIIQKSADATLTTDEQGIIDVICGEINRTMTLPSATTTHLIYTIRKADEGTGYVYIVGSNGELINDVDKAVLRFQGEAMTLVSDGVGWNIIAERRSEEAKMSSAVEVTASIFSVGTGYKDDGTYLDVSSSVVKGQVSVGMSGITDENLVKSSNMDKDSNADGVVDDFIKLIQGGASLTASFDTINKAQQLDVSYDTASGNGQIYQEFPIGEGEVLSLSVEAMVENVVGNTKGQINLSCYDSSNTFISTIGNVVFSNASFMTHKIENKTTPSDTAKVRIIFSGTCYNLGDSGTVKFRKAKLRRGATVGEYISSGVKSTFNVRLKSVGKNILDTTDINKWEVGALGGSGENLNSTTALRTKGFIPVNSLESIIYSSSGDYQFYQWRAYDENKNFVETPSTNTYTVPSNVRYIRVSIKRVDSANIQLSEVLNANVQLEYNTQATSYEPYKESVSYITLPDGVDGFHSLPNGTKDEISDDGKLIKRTKKYTTQSNDVAVLSTTLTNVDIVYIDAPSDIISPTNLSSGQVNVFGYSEYKDTYENVDNVSNVGKYTYSAQFSSTRIGIIVAKGTYADLASAQADLAGTTLIYQLAEEKVYDIPNFKDLYCYGPHTTIVIEPAIEFEQIADSNGQIIIPNSNLPINFIESVQEKIVDSESISYIDVSYSQVNTTTIGGLIYGKKYKVVYHYPWELTTIPTMTYRYPINMAATLQDVITIQQKLQKELGSVWITLLPLADKELEMYMITEIATPATATSEEIANKVNEILQVWKG